MEPPRHILQALEALHPQVRIGWVGKPRANSEELNAGEFHLLQLYFKRDAPRCFHDPWNDRGPVYGSRYDKLMYTPFRLAELTPRDVFGGHVVTILKSMLGDFDKEQREQRSEYGRDWDRYINDMAREAADRLLWEDNQTSAARGSANISYSDTTEDDKKVLEGAAIHKLEDELQAPKGSY